MDDTKIIYHIDDENTPYLVKLSVNSDKVTLGDFKAALKKSNYKFFFKSVDADFGVVKEEISDNSFRLPCFNGRVIAWLVSADGSAKSDNHSSTGDGLISKTGDIHEETNKNLILEKANDSGKRDDCETYSDDNLPPLQNFRSYKHSSRLGKLGRANQSIYDTSSSMLSSDLESTSFFDSEDESSRFSTATGTTVSSMPYGADRQRRRRRFLPISRISGDASSYSSMTDSTVSLNIVTVTLKMDSVNYLGVSIVGQSNRTGDGGIYVGSIMRGGAVALDGRVEPGDMLLEVNGISFEDMSNDDAVRVLREQVQKPGPITLVVAKSWDPNPRDGCFILPRQEPVRPIDPRAWVLHTNAMTAAATITAATGPPSASLHANALDGHPDVNSTAFCSSYPIPVCAVSGSGMVLSMPKSSTSSPSVTAKSTLDSTSGSGGRGESGAFLTHHLQQGSSQPPAETVPSPTGLDQMQQLNVNTDMAIVVREMLRSDSNLEIHDRTWLKITIANAIIGSDLVDWIFAHVDGFNDRREARKYAANMLKCGYIQHTVNKTNFAEQCYYAFSDLVETGLLNLKEIDSVSEMGGATRNGPTKRMGMMPLKISTGGSSISSVARSLPPMGFSSASMATAANAALWPSLANNMGGTVGMLQSTPIFSASGNPSQPLPPTYQYPTAILPAVTAGMQATEMKGLPPVQPQRRADVADEDGSSSTGSSGSTSTSSSSTRCSSTARQPQALPVEPVEPSVYSAVTTIPCSCLNLRRRRQNAKEAHIVSPPPSLSRHSSTISNRFADYFASGNNNCALAPMSLPTVGASGIGVSKDARDSEEKLPGGFGGGSSPLLSSPVAVGAGGRGPTAYPPPPTLPLQTKSFAPATGSIGNQNQDPIN